MLLAASAASSALDMLLQSLSSPKSSSTKPGGQKSAEPFDVFGGTAMSAKSTQASGLEGFPQISPATMSALLAAQGQSTTGSTASASTGKSDLLKDLFSQLDADGDGQVTKSEFESALGAGGTNIANADRVHSKLDDDGNGTVSLDEMLSALTGAGKGHQPAGLSGPNDKALQNASSNSVINADGSTTTSLSDADGSKVTTTSPAAAASRAATSSYNLMEQLIARQMEAFASTSSAWMSA